VVRLFVEVDLQVHPEPPASIVVDLDAPDDPLHGCQEDRFSHGYYGHDGHLPLYVLAGDFPSCAQRRASHMDAAAGCVDAVQRIVKELNAARPEVPIPVRGEAGACREALMASGEARDVEFPFTLACNARLERWPAPFPAEAAAVSPPPARPLGGLRRATTRPWRAGHGHAGWWASECPRRPVPPWF